MKTIQKLNINDQSHLSETETLRPLMIVHLVQSGDGDHGYGGETDQPSHYFGPRRVDYAAVSDRGVKGEVAYYQTL